MCQFHVESVTNLTTTRYVKIFFPKDYIVSRLILYIKQITLTYARCFQCKQEKFGNASENWMNFQQTMPTDETFKTTSQISFNDMGGRTDPFALRQNATTGNQAALDEYREKYTKSNHNFKRTYLGASNWKKSDQEGPAQ